MASCREPSVFGRANWILPLPLLKLIAEPVKGDEGTPFDANGIAMVMRESFLPLKVAGKPELEGRETFISDPALRPRPVGGITSVSIVAAGDPGMLDAALRISSGELCAALASSARPTRLLVSSKSDVVTAANLCDLFISTPKLGVVKVSLLEV